ncbi:MAG: hypothetical protein ACJ795_02625 [Ktedonobacteraceae bacterium]
MLPSARAELWGFVGTQRLAALRRPGEPDDTSKRKKRSRPVASAAAWRGHS